MRPCVASCFSRAVTRMVRRWPLAGARLDQLDVAVDVDRPRSALEHGRAHRLGAQLPCGHAERDRQQRRRRKRGQPAAPGRRGAPPGPPRPAAWQQRSKARPAARNRARCRRRTSGGSGTLSPNLRACAGQRPATLSRPTSLRAAAGSLPGRDRSLAALYGSIYLRSQRLTQPAHRLSNAHGSRFPDGGSKRCKPNRAPAETLAGCSYKFSAASASPRASSPAT